MTRIRRLYDKDQEVIIYNPIIEPLRIFLLHWLESRNLEIGNYETCSYLFNAEDYLYINI